MCTPLLENFVAGRWQAGTGAGTPLFDPVLGDELVRVDFQYRRSAIQVSTAVLDDLH